MNRILILGIAMFLAIVGIALVGGEKVAVAGHGHCCCCGGGCCGGGCCCGGDCCCGHHHRHHRHHCCCCGGNCCGGNCCGGSAPSCGGEGEKSAAPAPPAPMTSIQSDRSPVAFSHVSFVR